MPLLLWKATKGHAPQWVCVSVIFARSLGARPALGADTTVDIRCLSLLADARTSVPTVGMCEELMLVDCSLLAEGHKDRTLLWLLGGVRAPRRCPS